MSLVIHTVIAACHRKDDPEGVALHSFSYMGPMQRDEIEASIKASVADDYEASDVPIPKPEEIVIRDFMIHRGDLHQVYLPGVAGITHGGDLPD